MLLFANNQRLKLFFAIAIIDVVDQCIFTNNLVRHAHHTPVLKMHATSICGVNRFIDATEDWNIARPFLNGDQQVLGWPFTSGGVRFGIGQVVRPQHHVLRRGSKRAAIGRAQDVICRQHQNTRFCLCFGTQRYVNGHLVTVEVCVKCRTYERVNLNSFPFNQYGNKCLNTQPVQCRGTVQEHRMVSDDLFEHIPHA